MEIKNFFTRLCLQFLTFMFSLGKKNNYFPHTHLLCRFKVYAVSKMENSNGTYLPSSPFFNKFLQGDLYLIKIVIYTTWTFSLKE